MNLRSHSCKNSPKQRCVSLGLISWHVVQSLSSHTHKQDQRSPRRLEIQWGVNGCIFPHSVLNGCLCTLSHFHNSISQHIHPVRTGILLPVEHPDPPHAHTCTHTSQHKQTSQPNSLTSCLHGSWTDVMHEGRGTRGELIIIMKLERSSTYLGLSTTFLLDCIPPPSLHSVSSLPSFTHSLLFIHADICGCPRTHPRTHSRSRTHKDEG